MDRALRLTRGIGLYVQPGKVEMVPIQRIAELIGVTPDRLIRLETSPRHFAFVEVHLEYHTIKLTDSDEVTQIVTDAEGKPVGPRQVDEIVRISRSRLDCYRSNLGPALYELLIRHPRSVECDLTVRWAEGTRPPQNTTLISTEEVQRLLSLGVIEHAELRAEPEVLDADID